MTDMPIKRTAFLLILLLILGCSKPVLKHRDFTLSDLDGNTWTLAEHMHQPVILSFFATWCDLCQDELVALAKIIEGKPVSTAVICRDPQNAEKARQMVQQAGLTVPVLADEKIEVFAQFDIQNLPTTLLLNRQGEEMTRATGGGTKDRELLEVELSRLIHKKKKKFKNPTK